MHVYMGMGMGVGVVVGCWREVGAVYVHMYVFLCTSCLLLLLMSECAKVHGRFTIFGSLDELDNFTFHST
jgi:hypothetical protein